MTPAARHRRVNAAPARSPAGPLSRTSNDTGPGRPLVLERSAPEPSQSLSSPPDHTADKNNFGARPQRGSWYLSPILALRVRWRDPTAPVQEAHVSSSAGPADPHAGGPAAVRTLVRDAVTRAWAAAVEAGDLPSIADGQVVPPVEIERPANPDFGDVATNLAMKLARPLRRPPMEIAEALVGRLRGDPGAGIVASAEVARPGFVNLRVTDGVFETLVGAILADPAGWGRIPTVNPRRVNVEFVSANPTGPADRGQRAGRVRWRPAVPGARGRRSGRDARVLLQRLGRADRQPRSVGGGAAARRATPRGGVSGRLRPGARGRGAARRLERGDRTRSRRSGGGRRLGIRAGPGPDRGQPGAPRRPLRRLEERRLAA